MGVRNRGIIDSYFSNAVVASNLNDNALIFSVHANNPDVDTANIEDVWEVLQQRYVYPTIGNRLSLSSTTANDEPSGSGLGGVTIFGLDDNYDIVIESLDLNGVTIVTTDATLVRINGMVGYKNNSVLKDIVADGVITLKDGGNTLSQISATQSNAKQSMFTIPRGYTGFVKNAWLSGGANDDFIVTFMVAKLGGIFESGADVEISNSSFATLNSDTISEGIPEMSDIKVEANAVSVNSQVRVNYTVLLLKNDYLKTLSNSI